MQAYAEHVDKAGSTGDGARDELSTEATMELLRAKFSSRRARGIRKVQEKYQELKSELEADGATLVTTTTSGAEEASAKEMHQMTTSVDPSRLVPGEFVVHKKYGVGKFLGIKSLPNPSGEGTVDYMFLQYADEIAKLKASQAHRLLYRYRAQGAGGTAGRQGRERTLRGPKLSTLRDTRVWEKRCKKGRQSVRGLVLNVMDTYIKRIQQTRPPYPKVATEVHAAFEERFPYTLTPDQQSTIQEIENDLLSDTPMDRLVIGDVGFGKTEMAMRAIWQVVSSGCQVFVLCPTTLLAKQHTATLAERMGPFGIKVDMLSRFSSAPARRSVLAAIASGEVHVVVGTQALLSAEVDCKHLSMLVIDEEHRFGVKQKEAIMSLKTNVDVLTMSATPIPRTMHMAVAGFRDTSLLTTPPPERRPIKTQLSPFSREVLRDVVQRELDRDGQVFYVVPRVKQIPKVLEELKELLPEISVMEVHGKVGAKQQERIMDAFAEGKCNVLVATTIVEAGLDLPRANTIIIQDVHMFGLATLYQLRGRVGRSDTDAHALLMWPESSTISGEAQERILAIQDCCNLGDGFKLAERDMAIRGVGTIFGVKQSGDIDTVGIDLYLEMLHEELQKVETQALPHVALSEVQLKCPAEDLPVLSRPQELEELTLRITEASKQGTEGLTALLTELEEKHGGVCPPHALGMIRNAGIRQLGSELGIHLVEIRNKDVLFHSEMTEDAFEMIIEALPTNIRDGLVYHPGVIQGNVRPDLPSTQYAEHAFYVLSLLRANLPTFVKYM